MVLATKSKNTKFIIKFIAVVLSIVFMFGAAYQALTTVVACGFYDKTLDLFDTNELKQTEFYESDAFISKLHSDVHNIKYAAQYKNSSKLKKYILSQEETFVNHILSKNKKLNDEYNALLKRYSRAGADDGDGYVEEYDLEYEIDSFPKLIEYEYPITFADITYYINCYNFDNIYNSENEQEVIAKAKEVLEEFANRDSLTYDDDFNDLNNYTELRFYAINNDTGAIVSNYDDGIKPKDALKEKYSISIVDGKMHASDAMNSEKLISFIEERYDTESDVDIYAYLDLDGNKDKYTALIQANDSLKNKNYQSVVVSGALLAIASVGLMIYAFVICGRRKENGKVRPAFIDYIPADLHLVLTGLSIYGLAYLIYLIAENIYYYSGFMYVDNLYGLASDFSRYLCCAIGAVIWALFIEFVTSAIRLAKSDRKFYKNTLIGLIFYGIYKLFRKIFSDIKKVVEYNPAHFKKRLLLLAFGYVFVNIIFILLAAFSIVTELYAFGLIGVIVYFAMNIASLIFITRYIMQLDEIISAAQNRTVPKVNFDKLPTSLKTLVTSLHYTNKELNAAVNKAIKDERMRTELITNVSHDLKTPLTSIINYVDLLKQCDIDDTNAKEYIQVLDEKGIKLKRLIEDLIEASKLTSGVVTVNLVQLNLGELATQAVVEHQSDFIENGLDLIFKGDKQNIIAYADGNKTYRIIENLLSNAKKYSAKGSRVYADVYESNNACVFEIKNISSQPLDISAEELTERFVRGDKARNQEGNGLGLSIAENLCKVQKGRLEIKIDGDLFKARVILPKG